MDPGSLYTSYRHEYEFVPFHIKDTRFSFWMEKDETFVGIREKAFETFGGGHTNKLLV